MDLAHGGLRYAMMSFTKSRERKLQAQPALLASRILVLKPYRRLTDCRVAPGKTNSRAALFPYEVKNLRR